MQFVAECMFLGHLHKPWEEHRELMTTEGQNF